MIEQKRLFLFDDKNERVSLNNYQLEDAPETVEEQNKRVYRGRRKINFPSQTSKRNMSQVQPKWLQRLHR